MDLEAESITRGCPHPKNPGNMTVSNTESGAEVAARRMGQDKRRGEWQP
jgi:hypothetical protein